jgi:hypothetical protein
MSRSATVLAGLLLVASSTAACTGSGAGTSAATVTAVPATSPTGVATSAAQVAREYLANLPTFAPISREFEGAQLIAWPVPPGQPALLTIDYGGHDNIVVTALNPDGSQQELLVGATGPYAGTTVAGLFASPATVRIEAAGRGSIEFRPILAGRTWSGSAEISGRGDDVLLLDPPPGGPLTATIRNSATQTFAVTAFTPQTRVLLVDEIGNFAGTVAIPVGSILVGVHADGAWTISPR